MNGGSAVVAANAEGSIYDLGYRHYEGERHGRWNAMWALYVESLRGIWGLGRPATSKIAPFLFAGLYASYAFIQLALASVFSQAMAEGNSISLATYADYFATMNFFVIVFCIFQAPEVVCRDQRYTVLPLYFTRVLGRFEYAFARLASFATALYLVLLVPAVILFIGDVLMKPDTVKAIGEEIPKALPAFPAYGLIALSMAAISLSLSSFTPRRLYAAIGLFAYFLMVEPIPAAIWAIGREVGWGWSNYALLFTPTTALTLAMNWFFGKGLVSGFTAPPNTDAYVLAGLASFLVFTALLLFRYRRIAA